MGTFCARPPKPAMQPKANPSFHSENLANVTLPNGTQTSVASTLLGVHASHVELGAPGIAVANVPSFLQAKCACGGGALMCESCGQTLREPAQHSSVEPAIPNSSYVPDIAASSGASLPATTRERAERLFGSRF